MGFDYSILAIPKPPKREKIRRRIRHQSKRKAAEQRVWSRIVKARIEEAGGMCLLAKEKICTLKATDGHHKLPRSRGGKNDRDNCFVCCNACHMWIHDHSEESRRLGVLE